MTSRRRPRGKTPGALERTADAIVAQRRSARDVRSGPSAGAVGVKTGRRNADYESGPPPTHPHMTIDAAKKDATAAQLLAIIATQTEIARLGLDLGSVMALIAERAQTI